MNLLWGRRTYSASLCRSNSSSSCRAITQFSSSLVCCFTLAFDFDKQVCVFLPATMKPESSRVESRALAVAIFGSAPSGFSFPPLLCYRSLDNDCKCKLEKVFLPGSQASDNVACTKRKLSRFMCVIKANKSRSIIKYPSLAINQKTLLSRKAGQKVLRVNSTSAQTCWMFSQLPLQPFPFGSPRGTFFPFPPHPIVWRRQSLSFEF